MPTLTPQIIGRAENAHKPLMEHALAGTSLTFTQWACLALIHSGKSDVATHVVGALKVSSETVIDALDDLRARGLITPTDGVTSDFTDEGAQTFARIHRQIQSLVSRVYADIDDADLAVAARVLTTITAQADAVAAELSNRQNAIATNR